MARLPYVIPYDPDFLGDGFRVPLPNPCCKGKLLNGGQVIDYIHFSLVYHQDRKMTLYTAHNVDVSQKNSASRTRWDLDPRIPHDVQTGPSAYKHNHWDRGHLVRRNAVVWGDRQEAQDASDSTFYYTNASPQHERFNQEEWLFLENWVLQKAGGISSRLCVFTGPIYTDHDLFEYNTRIPSAFWKVIVIRDPSAEGDDLAALGFMMKQNELWSPWGNGKDFNLRLYQVGIQQIEEYTGINFGEISMLDEFEWRQIRFRDRSRMKPFEISGPQDIEFNGLKRRARGIRALRVGKTAQLQQSSLRSEVQEDDCGCGKKNTVRDKHILSLSKEVAALREMVEILLEENKGKFDKKALDSLRSLNSRVVGGTMVGPDEYLDCCVIGDGQEYFCTGVLVHPEVVLTAAHCGENIQEVYLGSRSLSMYRDQGEVRRVKEVFIHPYYDRDRVPSHDIAVLILEEPSSIPPIPLATAEEVKNEDTVILVGFGIDDPIFLSGFGTKRKVDVPISAIGSLSSEKIARHEEKYGYSFTEEFHTGGENLGRDSCNGDSGGPAYLVHQGELKLAGLTSRAALEQGELDPQLKTPCGDGGIYTRIPPYLNWIHQVSEGRIGEPRNGDSEEPQVSIDSAKLPYISSIQPNPAGPDEGREWVRLSNSSDLPIELSPYRLEDKQGGRHELQGVLSPKAELQVILPRDSALKLGNKGDSVRLFRANTLVHEVSYVSAGQGEEIHFSEPTHPQPLPPDQGDQNTDTDRPDSPSNVLNGADPC